MDFDEFLDVASPILSTVATQLGLDQPKRVIGLGSRRIRGVVEDRSVDLSADFWTPDPSGGFSPSPFLGVEMMMVGDDEARYEELWGELQPFNYWSYRVKYQGSAKSLGYSRWRGPPSGFVSPDGTFIADALNELKTSVTIRLVEDIYEGQTDPLTMPSLGIIGAPSVSFDRRDPDVTADDHIAKIRQLLEFSHHLEGIIRH